MRVNSRIFVGRGSSHDITRGKVTTALAAEVPPWSLPHRVANAAAGNSEAELRYDCCSELSRQKFSHIAQNFKQHRIRKLARKCILLARMVRRKKPRQISRQGVTRAMPKRKSSQSRNLPALFQQSQISPHRDAAQHQHRTRSQNFELALQKMAAIR